MSDEQNPQETEVVETPEVDSDELMAALDEGIVEVSPHIEAEDAEDGADDDAGGTEGDSEPDGEADTNETDDEPAGDEDADESGGDPDTDEDDGDGDEKGEKEGDGEKDGDKDDVGAEPDHINDPIPESTKKETAERIKSLIDIAKEQTQRADEGDAVIAAVTQAGADPDQFSNTLGFLSLYNSDKPEDRRQALEVARGVVHELSIELGEGSPALLDKHDDLKAQVEEGKLSEAAAVELATNREQKALQTARTEAASTTKDAETRAAEAVQAGKQALTDYGTSMANDPDYVALYPQYVPLLRTALRRAHPNDYAAIAKETFETLKANVAPPPPTPKPKKQPLRAKGNSGSGAQKDTAPKSAEEAMDAALDSM